MSEESKDYARGYAAGRRRQDVDIQKEQLMAERERFRHKVFLAALPSCLNGVWTQGEKKITSVDDRIALAWRMSDAAMRRY